MYEMIMLKNHKGMTKCPLYHMQSLMISLQQQIKLIEGKWGVNRLHRLFTTNSNKKDKPISTGQND